LRDIQKLIGKTIPQFTEHPFPLSPTAQPSAPVAKPHQRPNFKSRGGGGNNRSNSNDRNGRRSFSSGR